MGSATVGYGVGKFLWDVNNSHVAICSGLATICSAKLPPATVFVVAETVSYLFSDTSLTESSTKISTLNK